MTFFAYTECIAKLFMEPMTNLLTKARRAPLVEVEAVIELSAVVLTDDLVGRTWPMATVFLGMMGDLCGMFDRRFCPENLFNTNKGVRSSSSFVIHHPIIPHPNC